MPISRKELLAELQRLATEIEGTPTKNAMNQDGKFSASIYRNRFGSWGDAVSEAGFEPNSPKEKIPEEKLLEELDRLADALGTTPTATEMNDEGEYRAATYQERFGSWNEGVQAAGLDPNPKSPWIPEEKLLSELQRLADDIGQTPSYDDMKEHGRYTAETYKNRFGSWSEAVAAAGLEPNRRYEKVPDAELLQEIKRIAKEKAGRPTTTDMNKEGKYSAGTFINRFGSWGSALAVADLQEDG